MGPVSLFQELVKSKALQKGRFLGLDVGDKYIGVSVSDEHNKVALPGWVLVRKKSMIDLMATDFQSLISKFSIVGVIVGYPLDRQKIGQNTGQVNHLMKDLCATEKLTGVRYAYWNECFSSKNAQLFVQRFDDSNQILSKTISDKFAAIGILQSYLDFVNRHERLETVKEDHLDFMTRNERLEAVEEESDDEA